MYDTYGRIFTRLGLQFRAVAADTGSIRGHRLARIPRSCRFGRGRHRLCPDSDYAANVELAEAKPPRRHAELQPPP